METHITFTKNRTLIAYRLSFIFELLILFLMTTSCDKEESGPKSLFKYDGRTFELVDGTIQHQENPIGGLDHTNIAIYSKGVSWSEANKEFVGNGHLIFLRFRRDTPELQTGEYIYQAGVTGAYTPTMSTASFGIDWNFDSQTGTFGYFGEGSKVTISKLDMDQGKMRVSLAFHLVPKTNLGNLTAFTPVTGEYNGVITLIP